MKKENKELSDADLENDATYQQMLRTLERTSALEAAKPTVFEFQHEPEETPLSEQSASPSLKRKTSKTSNKNRKDKDKNEAINTVSFRIRMDCYKKFKRALYLYSIKCEDNFSNSDFLEKLIDSFKV